jgi:mannosyltransferase
MSTSEYPAEPLAGRRLPRLRARAAAGTISTDVWIVGLLFLVAAVIRFATIRSQSYWADESLTVYEAGLPFGAMINTVVHLETTPPLYFLLIWGWAKVFGTSEIALRSVSALAGLALVLIAYLCGRELISRWAGVIAAAFVTVNPFLIWYSQEARAYMLLAALCGASLLWFIRARQDPSRRNLTWWAVFSSLALMTHFFAGFVIAPEVLWLLWIHRTRAVLIASAVIAAAQAAMLPFAFIDSTHGVQWIALTQKYYRVGQVPLEFGLNTLYRQYSPTQGLIGGGLVLAIAVLLLAFGGDRRTRHGAAVAGTIAAVGVLLPLALTFVGQDYFLARNVIAAWLPLALVIAAACALPSTRPIGAGLAVGLIAIFVASDIQIQNNQYLQRPDWRRLAHTIGAAPVTRGILISGGTSADPLRIYLPRVTWVQPATRWAWIDEIDVVGTRRKQNLLVTGPTSIAVAEGRKPKSAGASLPRSISPRGTRILTRFSYKDWVVAKWRLKHPVWADTTTLARMAPRFFRRTPTALLILLQPAANK